MLRRVSEMVPYVAPLNRLRSDRRGSVALTVVAIIPVLIGVLALSVEVTNWALVKTELQRKADVAALAGALRYQENYDAQSATTAAARLAELNGASGADTTTWDAASATLTSGQIVAQLVSGINDSNDKAVQVTVSQAVPALFSRMFSSTSAYTIRALAVAELKPPVCLLTLSGQALTAGGNAAITAPNCVARSNGAVMLTGGGTINVFALYAAGTISGGGSSSISGELHPNAGTRSDPLAANTTIQTAIGQLSAGAGEAANISSGSVTLSPGTYSQIAVSNQAVVTLLPGTYYVNGDIAFKNSAQVSGSGVTFVTSGNVSFAQSAVVNLSAQSGSPGGAIPGVLFAGTTSGSVSFTSSTAVQLNGVLYFPHAALNLTSATNATSQCLEFIAYSASVAAGAQLSGHCAALGAPSFGPTTSLTTAYLAK